MLLSEACIIKQPSEVAALWGTTLMRTYSFSFIPEKSAPQDFCHRHTFTYNHRARPSHSVGCKHWAPNPSGDSGRGGGSGVSGYTVD